MFFAPWHIHIIMFSYTGFSRITADYFEEFEVNDASKGMEVFLLYLSVCVTAL